MLWSIIVAAVRKMIGQMLMVGLKAEKLSPDECSAFKELAVGGFILFKHNLIDPDQIIALCRSLWDIGADPPPFIAVDQEGGRVHRLPAPFTHFPAPGLLATVRQPRVAYQIARATATELAMVGINLNFAPVLDVNSNPHNPIIGDRSFGSDPQQVIRLGAETIAGLREGGILPCGKHFPGHGDTNQDSHSVLPVVDRSLARLHALELSPFVHACRNNIESLMTAHVLYPALDAEWPATLSRRIVTGLLRQQLGYDGVIFSDDLEMKAISHNYGDEQAAALSACSGVDVLLYGHELGKAVRAFEFLNAEAAKDRALRRQVEESYRKIIKLKGRSLKAFTGVTDEPIGPRLIRLGHQRLVDAIYGNR
jgi:beta-N-acetylhexosaminidase